MVDLSVKTIAELTVGTFVRVYLPSSANSELHSFIPRHQGLYLVEDGGSKHTLNHTEWRRIAGLNRRSFTAYVINNNITQQRLLLEFEIPSTTESTHLRYQVEIPYSAFLRIARLVSNAKELTLAEETKWRRIHRNSPVYKQCFSPFDQFVGVQILAYIRGSDMTINFTYQLSTSGTTFTIPLPSGAFEDGNYTVVASFNTLAGSPAYLSFPEVQRTSTQFNLTASALLSSGTTIDFHVKER